MIVGSKVHRRVNTKYLRSGPSARRGRRVPSRSHCVCCYARAPRPDGGGRKKKMSDGNNVTIYPMCHLRAMSVVLSCVLLVLATFTTIAVVVNPAIVSF